MSIDIKYIPKYLNNYIKYLNVDGIYNELANIKIEQPITPKNINKYPIIIKNTDDKVKYFASKNINKGEICCFMMELFVVTQEWQLM